MQPAQLEKTIPQTQFSSCAFTVYGYHVRYTLRLETLKPIRAVLLKAPERLPRLLTLAGVP